MGSFLNAAAILAALKDQASKVLAPALDATPLETFAVTDRGTFPYNWQDPVDEKRFNRLTYEWIAANLKARASPLQQDGSFTDLYIRALGNVAWELPVWDQARLNQVMAGASQQAAELLNAWIHTFGAGWSIDAIAEMMTTWTSKQPTSLVDIQSSPAPYELFDQRPAAGSWVIPPFLRWLNALHEALPLYERILVNNRHLRLAIKAAREPSAGNGGLMLDDGSVVPRYQIAKPMLAIRNALQTGPSITLSMSVKRRSATAFGLSVSGGAESSIPTDFLSIDIGDGNNFFASDLAVEGNETAVDMCFTGVNFVKCGPVPSQRDVEGSSWFWIEPIIQAISNSGQDIAGFRFSAPPGIDFRRSGPFGLIAGVAVSAYPTIKITIRSARCREIQRAFERAVASRVSFLRIRLASPTEQNYSNQVAVDTASDTATVILSPPPTLVAGADKASRAWVLGVQPDHPTAAAAARSRLPTEDEDIADASI
ncbi:hypothetical protein [Dongia sp. agr-C8]